MTPPLKILNLGCGTRTSPSCINVDWSISLRLKRSRLGSRLAPLVMRGERLERFKQIDPTIIVHDLRQGIPAQDSSADAVYHSHVLEHLDRDLVADFFAEVKRVLKPGGIHRIVVPDLEYLSRRYLENLERCLQDASFRPHHDLYIADIIEQSVRREAWGTSQQNKTRRFVENLILGDARRRGETHQWMYDRINLAQALSSAGFRDVGILDYKTSFVPGWGDIHLDCNDDGSEHKPGSLYVEAVR